VDVGSRLPPAWERVHLGWPGLGDQAADPSVRGYGDLVERVLGVLERPSDLVAQSMGGVVAVSVAARAPGLVRRLVLSATSGGIDMGRLGAVDWREEYGRVFPRAAAWVGDPHPDQTELLRRIESPTLLLWGDADPLSPVAVGERLAELIPGGVLRVISGATHDLALEQPGPVARLIEAHLR
jgi:pimeloyl-ACP methyl ester carboxylesterase